MTFTTFSPSVADNISVEMTNCYRNNHIAFLFMTVKTSSIFNNSSIIIFPFQIKSRSITIVIPASSVGQWNTPNEFVYGYISTNSIIVITTTATLWLHLNLVLHI